MRPLVVLLAAAGVAGCESPEYLEYQKRRADMWMRAEQQAIDNCVKKGGSPVRSSWDGRFVDCK